VYRGELNFVVLNLFPYTGGHVMGGPFQHEASLASLAAGTTAEMMELAKRTQRGIELEYKPDGFNIGFNLCTGDRAGTVEHLHLHVVPRWCGDANFMSVIGETRVMPEDLAVTWSRLSKHFAS